MTKLRFFIALAVAALIYGCTTTVDKPKTTETTTKTVSVENTVDVSAYEEYQTIRTTERNNNNSLRMIENENYSRRMAIVEETNLPYAVADTIVALAEKYDFYDHTIVGVINLESKYNVMATNVNSNGTVDKGLMQINSSTFPWLSKVSGNPNADPYNADDSVKMGVWYLDYLRTQCGGSLTCALARYNGDSTGAYQSVVRDRIDKVASRMGVSRERMNQHANGD